MTAPRRSAAAHFGLVAAVLLVGFAAAGPALAAPAVISDRASPSPKPNPGNTFQEYQYACLGGNPFTTQETCNFTPTPAGKFAKVQNASCLMKQTNAQLKHLQLRVLEGDVVKSVLTLNHVVTFSDETETWISAHDRITAYVAAGQRVQIFATLFEVPSGGSTDLVCHISGTY